MGSDDREFLELSAEFKELSDPEVNLYRELYAHFGLTFNVFALAEHTLINAAHLIRLYQVYEAGLIETATDWEREWESIEPKVNALTFGNLAREIVKVAEFSDLVEELKRAKDNRDFLAHRFFRETVGVSMSDEGCRLLLVRLAKTRKRIDALDGLLSKRYSTMFKRMGLPNINEIGKLKIVDQIKNEAEALLAAANPDLGWEP